METKVTVHWQRKMPAWFPAWAARTGARWAKGMNDFSCPPGVRLIARFYIEEARTNAMMKRGATGAEELFGLALPTMRAHPSAWCWEVYNEPSIWDPTVLAGFNDFNIRLRELFDAHFPLRFVSGCINTWWPQEWQISQLAAGLRAGHYVGLHEYAWPHLWDGGGDLTLHYRDTHGWLDGDHPPFLVTELGLDEAVLGTAHKGWRKRWSPMEYAEQLLWYERELRKDAYVEAATVFISEADTDWLTFEWDEAAAFAYSALLDQPPPPSIDRAKGLYVSEYQGAVDWDRLRADGHRYVHVRASSGLHADPTFAANWEAAGRAGFLRSAWHYLDVAQSNQAAFFADVVGDREPELGFCADVEANGLTPEKVRDHMSAVDALTGRRDNVYTRPGLAHLLSLVDPAGRWLWSAEWTGDPNAGPQGIPGWEALFVQWRDGTEIPGVAGRALPDVSVLTEEELREKFGGQPVGEINARFWDIQGQERDQAWAETYFGAQDAHQPDGLPAYRLMGLQEARGGSKALKVLVTGAENEPLEGIEVRLGPRDVSGQVCSAFTGADGVATLAMTEAHKFYVPGQGHYAVGIPNTQADVYNSAGWVAGQDRWLNLFFQVRAEEPPGDVKYCDGQGNEVTRAWMEERYGPFVLHPKGPGPGWRIKAIRENTTGLAGCAIRTGAAGMNVSWYWPDVKENPACQPPNGVPEGMRANRSEVHVTKADGIAAPGMWSGSTYWPQEGQRGPHACWICGANSDVLWGIGLKGNTNHHHVEPEYEWVEGGPAPVYRELDLTVVGAGTVVATPKGTSHPDGTVVELAAMPDPGWAFAGWSGDLLTMDNPASLVMDADKAVRANFLEEGGGPDVEAAIEEARAVIAASEAAIGHAAEAIRLLGGTP